MAILKTNIAKHPVAGQGLGGQTTHHSLWPVSITGAITSGDTAEVARLPVNARLLSMTVKNSTGVSLTFSLGIAGTPALLRASAALADGVSDRAIADAGLYFRVPEGAYPYLPVIATFGANAVAGTGPLWVNIAYVVDEPVQP